MKLSAIAGFPRYHVSASGEVLALQKDGSFAPKRQILGRNGYYQVSLWRENQERRAYVHHLVLDAFVGPRPFGHEALHENGDRRDNRLENLRWGTRKQNVADAIRHGTATVGARNGGAKLSRSDVFWIRDMQLLGFTPRECTRYFPVSVTTIRRLLRGATYSREQLPIHQ